MGIYLFLNFDCDKIIEIKNMFKNTKKGAIKMVIQGNVIVNQSNRTITVGDEIYPFPKGVIGRSVTTINGKSYIDGYELVGGKWKKTLKGIFYKYI